MKNLSPVNYFRFFIIALLLQCFLAFTIKAERLSFTTYSLSNGLVNDTVNKIYPDSRGFLWFCTSDGLSRFDGYKFKNYTQNDGLPHRNINDFIETKDGTYLIATTGGLAVFNPNGKNYRWNIIEEKLEQNSDEPPLFKTYLPDLPESSSAKSVTSLAQDNEGNIYVGTKYALFHLSKTGSELKFKKIEYPEWEEKTLEFNALLTDSQGGLWIATSISIYRMSENRKVEKIHEAGGNSLFLDHSGNVWVDSGGNNLGIRVYSFQNGSTQPILTATYNQKDGLPLNTFTNALAQTSNGTIFIVSDGKPGQFLPYAKPGEPKFKIFSHSNIATATTDKSGNLWFGTVGSGAFKHSINGFQTFDERDGIPPLRITSIFSNRKGEVFFTSGKQHLVKVESNKFEAVKPKGIGERSWGTNYLDLQSKDEEWWIPSTIGLLNFPKVFDFRDLAKTSPKKIYTVSNGLFFNEVFNIFEDSRGDIWVSIGGSRSALQRLEKSTGKIYDYEIPANLANPGGVVSFGEDKTGNLWFGLYYGGLVRFKDGKPQAFTEKQGIPRSYISQIISDIKGRLWISTSSRGIFRVDNPDDDVPQFISFSTSNGLSSNQTMCLAQDNFGRIFVGTGRGITRLTPETGQVKNYTEIDGLPSNVITNCYADKNGALWFSSNSSLIRFVPQQDIVSAPPPIFVDEIRVNGVDYQISELGENIINNLEFSSDERQIQISFYGLSFNTAEKLLYQYKLNNQEWSDPTDQRTISFNLSSGNYKLEVRAINADGIISSEPAIITFRILSSIWLRWWFITLAFLTLAGLIFALDRYRVRKTRQVEKALDETRRANVMIRESENRFRTLADTASDAILTIDTDNNIIFVNQAVEKVFGYSAEELIGQKMSALMPQNVREKYHAGLTRYLTISKRNTNGSSFSLFGLHKDGHEIPLEVSFGEFERDGKRYFTGIARDISERKRAEKALQEAREEKFKELERVRTRIATDLHDDIGSSLTQIAVLTEVARGQANHLKAENLSTPLERIKGVSKELVSVMSDVVWAINPNKDFLHDLIQRMRRFASDVYSGKGIKFEFNAPELKENLSLGANIRREVFAIFKESVNNSVKYSECTLAKIEFQISDNKLFLKVEDNGKGFDTEEILSPNFKPEIGGNGLVNIQRRATEMGGHCRIESEIKRGTIITIEIPLHQNIEFTAQKGGDN